MNNLEYSWWENFLFVIGWYKFIRFIEEWIYPAYYLRNLLFYRYDRIKVPQVKPYEYTDKSYLSLCANMQIIVDFLEKEKPEERVVWYGKDGHIYGEFDKPVLFQEYKGKYIMDIIKEIYQFWTFDREQMLKDNEVLLDFACKYLYGDMVEKAISKDEKGNTIFEVEFDESNCPKTLLDIKNPISLDVIKKYISEEDMLDKKKFVAAMDKLENDIYFQEQKYLHLCIEVRSYLWT